MSHYFPTLATGILGLLLSASPAFAQTTDECEKLKNDNAKLKFENANLKKGIIARSPANAPVQTSERTATSSAPTGSTLAGQPAKRQTAYKVEYALVKCQGNAKSQTVTITLLLTNAGANQVRRFTGLKAVDDQGEEYMASETKIGSSTSYSTLATGVPVKATAIIPKILSTTRKLNLVTCSIYGEGHPGGTIPIEFRDVVISWK
ncbi:hypothetical protein [Hymenobacter antarcticus]|uniref:Uncharacterized protein n=1 Tax=Hymenobacter antarcticus TaxID=486270 RepID=A0ABP7QTU7_9BACT